MLSPNSFNQPKQPPKWANSPTLQAVQTIGNEWDNEDSAAGPGIRQLVESEHHKKTPVLDYTVGVVPPDYQNVVQQNYRSAQLIKPEPKAKHYLPTGSYLNKMYNGPRQAQPKIGHDTCFGTNLPTPPSVVRRRPGYSPQPRQPQYQNQYQPQQSTQYVPQHQAQYQSGPPSPRPVWAQSSGPGRTVQWPPQQELSQPAPYSQQQSLERQNSQQMAYEIDLPNPDPNSRVVHLQYNTPIGLYSAQNVCDSLAGQTGLSPPL